MEVWTAPHRIIFIAVLGKCLYCRNYMKILGVGFVLLIPGKPQKVKRQEDNIVMGVCVCGWVEWVLFPYIVELSSRGKFDEAGKRIDRVEKHQTTKLVPGLQSMEQIFLHWLKF